jgi:hypothetical protein
MASDLNGFCSGELRQFAIVRLSERDSLYKLGIIRQSCRR